MRNDGKNRETFLNKECEYINFNEINTYYLFLCNKFLHSLSFLSIFLVNI